MTESSRAPAHRRSLQFDVYDDDPGLLRVVARLRDERPWAQDPRNLPVVHDLELIVSVGRDDLVIRSATAVMNTYPHAECPFITGAYRRLEGLAVARGYTRALRERLGGPAGCTHLSELARAMGPVVLQSAFSAHARGMVAGTEASDDGPGDPRVTLAFLRDTCHVWAEDGVGMEKLRRGWRPGTTAYPIPPLAEFPEP
ncbi:MAG: DUF2889 domain-containing protein [Candidatus Nanopelagicales bacterium]